MRSVIDPLTNKPVTEVLGGSHIGLQTYPSGCRRMAFHGGDITSYDHTRRYPIVCIYGPIWSFYEQVGEIAQSVFGRPLSDVRDLPDGSRCAVFEGGHIHQWGSDAHPYVSRISLMFVECNSRCPSFPASECTAASQPPPPPFPFGMGPNKVVSILPPSIKP